MEHTVKHASLALFLRGTNTLTVLDVLQSYVLTKTVWGGLGRMSCVVLRGELLTTILLLWEVPNHHILEALTSTDKLLRHVCSMGKVFKIFESQPYLAGHAT